MGLRAGRLREQVIIQAATSAQDGYGQPIETWGTFAAWQCEVQPLRGREYLAAKQLNAQTSHRLTGHWLSGVLPTMRVLWGSRVLRIESVINQGERNRTLELMCIEVLGG